MKFGGGNYTYVTPLMLFLNLGVMVALAVVWWYTSDRGPGRKGAASSRAAATATTTRAAPSSAAAAAPGSTSTSPSSPVPSRTSRTSRSTSTYAADATYALPLFGEETPPPSLRAKLATLHRNESPYPFRQVGVLLRKTTAGDDAEGEAEAEGKGKGRGGPVVLPLLGRRVNRRSARFHYTTANAGDAYRPFRLPMSTAKDGRDTMEERGVDELFDGDEVTVPPYGTYVVDVYLP